MLTVILSTRISCCSAASFWLLQLSAKRVLHLGLSLTRKKVLYMMLIDFAYIYFCLFDIVSVPGLFVFPLSHAPVL